MIVLTKVNEVLAATGCRMKPPTVVAIGNQSSGKSSVLENIVGRDFLPRGQGLVTRCPLELQLVNVPKQPPSEMRGEAERTGVTIDSNEWAEFAHIDGRRRFYNFDDVRAEIVRQMDKLAGKNKGIVATPISLTIYSPRVPDLLIVDLPGLVKNPHGDQPSDIEQQIRDMWATYIRAPDAVVLAVTPANHDIVADDALRIALEADPDGERTIGVLTKLDLMDPGTDARDVLAGRIISLKRGFVPVVCRGQRDLQEGVGIDKSLARERTFFERHAAYRSFASRCGTTYLARTLSHMLIAAIKLWLPRVRTELSLMMQYAEQQMRDLGRPVDAVDVAAAGQTVLRLLTRFAANFNDMLDGRVHADAGDDMLTQLLFGGARIQEHIRSRFFKAVDDWMRGFVNNAHTTLPSAEILMALRNSSGPRPTLFIPEQAFVALARRYIRTLKEQGRRFVQYIYDELRRVASQCQPTELNRFGDLRERAVEVVHDLLRRCYTPTQEMVDNMIDFELSHINTLHPDFIGAEGAMRAVQADADKDLFAPSLRAVKDVCYLSTDEEEDGMPAADEDVPFMAEEEDIGSGDEVGDPAHISHARARSRERERESASVPSDVEWAIQQLGGVVPGSKDDAIAAASAAVRARASPRRRTAPMTPAPSRSRHQTPASGSSGASGSRGSAGGGGGNDSIRDVTERFHPSIVADITGHGPDDPIPAGAVRVGGKHSPFVAQPVSRVPVATALAAGLNTSPAPPSMRGGMHGSPGSPGLSLGVMQSYGSGGGGLAGSGLFAAMGDYVHYEVTQLPSRPLPALITPAHLKPTPKEKVEVRVIRYLLWSYLSIVKKTYQDMVPKVVMSMLVTKVREEISSELVHKLYAAIVHPDALLKETDEVSGKRRVLGDHLRVLSHALEVLNEVRDFGSGTPASAASAAAAAAAAAVSAAGYGHAYSGGRGAFSAPASPASLPQPAYMTHPGMPMGVPSVGIPGVGMYASPQAAYSYAAPPPGVAAHAYMHPPLAPGYTSFSGALNAAASPVSTSASISTQAMPLASVAPPLSAAMPGYTPGVAAASAAAAYPLSGPVFALQGVTGNTLEHAAASTLSGAPSVTRPSLVFGSTPAAAPGAPSAAAALPTRRDAPSRGTSASVGGRERAGTQ